MTPNRDSAAPSASAHLSDADLIEIGAGVSAVTEDQQNHARTCRRCARSLTAIAESLTWFDAPETRERLESRIRPAAGASPNPSGEPAGERSWLSRLKDSVSLAPLRPRDMAYAGGDDTESVEFPIYDGERESGCIGAARRRGRDVYLLAAAPPGLEDAHSGKQVEIAIFHGESEEMIVTRTVDFDQPSLVGSDMDCAALRVAARLSP